MNKTIFEENVIVKLTFEFSIQVVLYVEELEKHRKFVIANQLLRSGTSIGANVYEAQNAESKADFIHKFKIAAKEMDETYYWLMLCKQVNYLPPDKLFDQLEALSKIITKIITTSKINNSVNRKAEMPTIG